jgi:hypothetical protein
MASAGPGYTSVTNSDIASQTDADLSAPPAEDEPEFKVEPLILPTGRVSDADVIKVIRAALQKVGDDGETPGSSYERNVAMMTAWRRLNMPVINALETKRKVHAYKEIAMRLQQLGIPANG